MRRRFSILVSVVAALAVLSASTGAPAAIFYPISGVTLVQSSEFFPLNNLIEGPDVGYDAVIPHNRLSNLTWVTDSSGGDYYAPTVGPTPIFTVDLGQDRALTEIDVWGYASSNANGVSKFSLRFATNTEGTGGFGTSIAYNPTFFPTLDHVPRQQFPFSETVTAQYVEFTALDNLWNAAQIPPGGDRVGLGEIAFPVLTSPPLPPTGTGIINPTLVDASDLNTDSNFSPLHLTNNSGLSDPVNDGDSLAHALSVTQQIDGPVSSWVTNGNTANYFGPGPNPPTFVWDLRADVSLDEILLWQYPSSGGGDQEGNGTRSGNSTRTVELRFNTEADGFATFSGTPTTVTMSPILDTDPGVPLVIAPNFAEDFGLDSIARYVEMRIVDNHYGDPDGLGVHPTIGGDRVGLGEVRFYGTVPEPSSWVLALMACVGLGLFFGIRRHDTKQFLVR